MPDAGLAVALTATYAWPEVRRGGERYLHELAASLVRRGHRVHIVATAPTAGRDEVLGVPVRLVGRHRAARRLLGPRGDELWFGAQALARVPRASLDVWHALTVGDAAAAGVAGRCGGPRSVFTALGIPTLPGRGPAGALHRLALATVDRYVCLSDRAAAPLRETVDRSLDVVGAGVDTHRFRPGGARHDQPVLLFASDASAPWKNLPLLLAACDPVVAARPDLEIWLAGPGDPTAAVTAATPRVRDRVTRTRIATPDEVAELYGRAWVTALPSRNEAFGMVALESLACGTPAVVLEGEGPATFVDASVGARAAPDAGSLAEAILGALELASVPDVAEACRARALEHGWDEVVVPALEEVYGG